ncbi:MAG: hypothetical protein J3R72DRAFT_522426 [Linnemannia gamsii]|nr:MAG: hypothetical protein J3R72DRAFT_522426 [Linnemannia gamsii]
MYSSMDDHLATTQTPLQVLEALSQLAKEGDRQTYDTFLGMEKTPTNLLFFKTTTLIFILQFILFYLTWAIFPIFGKERRRLSWTLSFYCSVGFLIPCLLEFGYVRLTIHELLGFDAVSLGVANPETASVFSVWMPRFLSWVQQLPAFPFSATEVPSLTWSTVLDTFSSTEGNRRFIATALQWMVSLPIFSLAPLKPTQLLNPHVSSRYLGDGSRLLFSLENHPHESVFGAIAVGYFVGYSAADLILGYIHYRDQVDPLSGWVHHIVYILLAWRVAVVNQLSLFAVCGGPLELSTVFLASGYMFPRLRSAFWFPFTFILVRIIGHALILQELLFNYPTPWGAAELFVGVLVLHIYWIYKYFVGLRRRTRQARKAALEQGGRGEKGGAKEASAVVSRTGLFKGAFSSPSASTLALTTGSAGKTIQLRIQKSKK